MEEKLRSIGLSDLQAKAYIYLLDAAFGKKPAQIARALGISRTNAYKVLDSLVEYDLVRRSETGKTLIYIAENPIALTNFAAKARNHAREVEASVKDSMRLLQKRYQKKLRHADVQISHGKEAIILALRKQIHPNGTLHFIRSRADIPFMGFEAMHKLRYEPSEHGMQRFGITPQALEANPDPAKDLKTNLTRTFIPSSDYTSPVEWTVSGDELAIINYTDSGTAIRIKDEHVAESFRQIWHILDKQLRSHDKLSN